MGAIVIRRCVVGAFGVGLVIAVGSPAFAAPYPAPPALPPSVSAGTTVQGESVTFTAGGFTPNTTVTVLDNGVPVGTATADANGVFVLAVTVANCGANSLTATGVGDNGPVSVSAAVQGVCTNPASTGTSATAGPATATALPRTGNSLAVPGAIAGTALIVLGGTAIVVSRRRREDQQA